MTAPFPTTTRRTRRRARRWPFVLVGLALAFAAGLAVGQAIEEGPDPATTVTHVRTLKPLPVAPAPVTVTTTVGGNSG